MLAFFNGKGFLKKDMVNGEAHWSFTNTVMEACEFDDNDEEAPSRVVAAHRHLMEAAAQSGWNVMYPWSRPLANAAERIADDKVSQVYKDRQQHVKRGA